MSIKMETAELEKTSINSVILGSIADFGIGRGTICSSLSNHELVQFADNIKNCVVKKSGKDEIDHFTLWCIDGRGSESSARGRQAGGNLSYIISGVLAETSVLKTGKDASFSDMLQILIDHGRSTIGLEPSSHDNGCGAADKLIDHIQSVRDGKVDKATQAIVSLIEDYLKTEYNIVDDPSELNDLYTDETIAAIKRRADSTQIKLNNEKWVGKEYTDYVEKTNKYGIEHLNDGGHKEQAIVLFFGRGKTISKRLLAELGYPEVFVITVDDSIESSLSLVGNSGLDGFKRALVANVAFQSAVAHNLSDKDMPIIAVYA